MEQQDYPGPPKWVRWLIIGFALFLVAFVALHLTGNAPNGGHGS